jgi:RNA polymerase sigma-70 factor (ECF subfamily)
MSTLALASPSSAGAVGAGRLLVPDRAADHRTRLYRLARAMCGSSHLAEDLVQSTYLRVFSRPRLLRGDDDFSYLAGTLRNVLLNHLRSEGRRGRPGPAVDELDPPDNRGSGDPEAALMAGEVLEAIAALPEAQREVITAVDVEGVSYAEAAEALGMPIGTVMSRLHRGRARVARVLEG